MASEYSLDHLSYWTNLFGGPGFVDFAVSRRVVRAAKLGHSVQLSAWSEQVVQKSLQSAQVWVIFIASIRNRPALQVVQLSRLSFVHSLHGVLQESTHLLNYGCMWLEEI
jgi:hypothetical protein